MVNRESCSRDPRGASLLALRVLLATVAGRPSYFIDDGVRRHAARTASEAALSCASLALAQRARGNSTCSRNYMYAICTSHSRKDGQKKSAEKSLVGEVRRRRRRGGRRVIKALYKDTQTEATAGTKAAKRGERDARRNVVEARKSSSVKANY